jgi:putative ABC transport system ATP-binding protein
MKHRPNQLSGGQQQRVAIARALSTHPSLILADEPTGNLDSKSGQDIMRMLHELHEQGNAIMLITHDNAISLEAERRMAIRDGRISQVNGNHDVTKTLEAAEGETPVREESAS